MTLRLASRKYPARMTAVYRLYDAADRLLYVGIGFDFDSRWKSHAENKSWWPQVARKDVIWFDNRLDAAYEEARAIRFENPLHNERPGIYPIGVMIVRRFVRPIHIGWWARERELIVNKPDIDKVFNEVACERSHALVAFEGQPVAFAVPIDWFLAAREQLGEPPTLDDVPAMEIDEFVGRHWATSRS